jgi:hypothetical protein
MSEERTHLYTSENGDRWSLCRGPQGVAEVLHEPNAKSGGAPSRTSVDDFLATGRNGLEHQALRQAIAQSSKVA